MTGSKAEVPESPVLPHASDIRALHEAGVSPAEIHARYALRVPALFNMAGDTVTRHARGPLARGPALVIDDGSGAPRTLDYRTLDDLSNRLAAHLRGAGAGLGDVCVVHAGQGLIAALGPLAAYKLGAINAPLSPLLGPQSVAHVLADSRARFLLAETAALEGLRAAGVDLSQVAGIVVEGPPAEGATALEAALAAGADGFAAHPTRAEDPALLLYTSGSTGLPKGILHAHRLVLGYLASVSMFYELDMTRPGMRLWTPSDWSWIAGIVNVMMTGWYFGQTVIAGQARFDPGWAFDFVERNAVTHCFLTPTALKRMAELPDPAARWPGLALRAIGTGGEPLPGAVLDWARASLGVPINEFYGLTEVNHLIGNCHALYPVRAGSMGRCYPGHRVAVIDEAGQPVPDGTVGEIAAHTSDPTLFLGYLNQPARTAAMRTGDWVRTGDFALRDAEGYFWYQGRADDLIKSAGYRIGPAEVEDALLRHPAVAEAAVVGLPDPDRGQIVAAFVRPAEGAVPGAALAAELQAFVKAGLALYKYPRRVEFVEDYPMTSTGKISRKALRAQYG